MDIDKISTSSVNTKKDCAQSIVFSYNVLDKWKIVKK